ncbi:hypothetical protein KSZ_18230 [Dictyobacter formicarum]|uniref:Uncharacterized protein n=1 Tax=Dictyobacter formicarum TaxID=2778368 RepID=A0ABQ3VCD7_9CHLR|nr:hypothetical protein KSZ_18230 [Dictyobacter formicarum]
MTFFGGLRGEKKDTKKPAKNKTHDKATSLINPYCRLICFSACQNTLAKNTARREWM